MHSQSKGHKLKTSNQNFITVITTIGLILLSGVSFADNPPVCTENGGGAITSSTTCITEPDTMTIKANHMYMCYSKPRAPTTSLASNQRNDANTAGVCTQQLWPNPVGKLTQEFNVESGASNSLANAGGNFRGVVGKQTFTHFTLYLDPYFKMQTIQEFSADVQDRAGNVGRFCWTLNADVFTNRADPGSVNDTVACGTEAEANAGVGQLTTRFNYFGDNDGDYADFTIDGVSIDAYLIKSDEKLISTPVDATSYTSNDVAEILAHVSLPTGTYMESCANKQKGTLRVGLQWRVSEAVEFKFTSPAQTPPKVYAVSPSEFYLQVVPTNGGTCH